MTSGIVIVESSPVMRRELERILQRAGFSVVSFSNSADALEYVRREGAKGVICELKALPVGGTELCRALKGDPRFREVTFLISVGILDEFSERDAKGAGADGVLRKPFKEGEVLEALRRAAEEAKREDVIELTEVVEEPEPKGPEPSARELKKIEQVLRESALEMERVQGAMMLKGDQGGSAPERELEEALREVFRSFAEQLARALSREIRRQVEEILKENRG